MHFAGQCLDFGVALNDLRCFFDLNQEEIRTVHEANDFRPSLAFDEHLHGTVGKLEHLDDRADSPGFIDIFLRGLIGLGVFLR